MGTPRARGMMVLSRVTILDAARPPTHTNRPAATRRLARRRAGPDSPTVRQPDDAPGLGRRERENAALHHIIKYI